MVMDISPSSRGDKRPPGLFQISTRFISPQKVETQILSGYITAQQAGLLRIQQDGPHPAIVGITARHPLRESVFGKGAHLRQRGRVLRLVAEHALNVRVH